MAASESPSLHDLVRDEIAPGTGVAPDSVWSLLDDVVQTLGPRNRALLAKRDRIAGADRPLARGAARQPLRSARVHARFLREIGYLVPDGAAFRSRDGERRPRDRDAWPGPQLVVPVDNPRYALNAANARWGSLYDALYGTNVIPEDGGAEKGRGYNPARGERVIARANQFLDEATPLADGQAGTTSPVSPWPTASSWSHSQNGAQASLADATQFAGYRRAASGSRTCCCAITACTSTSRSIATHPIGRQHPAGIKDVVLESAVTTIMDCEDSVATVDAADKTVVYRNWCGIMRGTLTASFAKGGAHDRAAAERGSRVHGAGRRDARRCRAAACCSFGTSAPTCSRTRSPTRRQADRRRHSSTA